MTPDHGPKKCNRPECENPARVKSEFCSDTCRALENAMMDKAPYGDHFHYPMYPVQ